MLIWLKWLSNLPPANLCSRIRLINPSKWIRLLNLSSLRISLHWVSFNKILIKCSSHLMFHWLVAKVSLNTFHQWYKILLPRINISKWCKILYSSNHIIQLWAKLTRIICKIRSLRHLVKIFLAWSIQCSPIKMLYTIKMNSLVQRMVNLWAPSKLSLKSSIRINRKRLFNHKTMTKSKMSIRKNQQMNTTLMTIKTKMLNKIKRIKVVRNNETKFFDFTRFSGQFMPPWLWSCLSLFV